MNVITTTRTYATVENATKALIKALALDGLKLDDVRWLIAVAPGGRFAPTLVGASYIRFAHAGIMIVG